MWLWNFKLREGSFPAVAAVVCGVQRWCGVLISLQYYIKRESSAPAAADGSSLHCAFSWHKLCRVPLELGDTVETWTVETSGDLLKTWTLARDQEETWRLGGDVSRTRAIFPLRRCCSCVVLAAGQQPSQPSQPRPAHRRLSIENYLIHDVSCLPTSASALSQGTNISTFYFLLHILSFLTILILLWEFSNI